MFYIHDGGTEFQQWEQNKMLTNEHMAVGDCVIFRNAGGKTIPMDARMENGTVVVDVPNDLLMDHTPIVVDLEGRPSCRTKFKVNKYDCPAGYVPKKNEHRVACNAPDWNQNDPSAPDYVKNRPFYTETDVVDVVPTTDVTFEADPEHPEFIVGSYVCHSSGRFIEGTLYTIVWDGKIYDCVAKKDESDSVYIGNDWLWYGDDSFDDDGTPFVFSTYLDSDPDGYIVECGTYPGTNATVSVCVKAKQETVHKLDSKYLPDDIGGTKPDMVITIDDLVGTVKKENVTIESGTAEDVFNKIHAGQLVDVRVRGISGAGDYVATANEIKAYAMSYAGVLYISWMACSRVAGPMWSYIGFELEHGYVDVGSNIISTT